MMPARTTALAAMTSLVALAGGLLFSSAPAGAFTDHTFVRSFGPGGPGMGAFADPQSIAVDQSTGDVYVYDNNEDGEPSERGRIYKFNAAGEPANFLAHANASEDTNVIEGIGDLGNNNGAAQIAVDNSSGPDKGDIYFANYDGEVEETLIYDSNGVGVGVLASYGPSARSCGVAVDSAGAVYIRYPGLGQLQRYVPVTNPVKTSDYASELSDLGNSICNIAIDSEGNAYTAQPGGGPVTKYPASQFSTKETRASGATIPGAAGSTLAVDPLDNDVFVDEGSKFTQYSSSGGLLGASETGGAIAESFGIAVSDAPGSTGDVYVSDNADHSVDIYGPVITLPDALTGQATALRPNGASGEATLNGTVNADNTSGASYQFQYGTETSYGSTTPATSFAGTQTLPASSTLTALLPNTAYHYRLDATNSSGLVNYGPDRQFTLVTPPMVNDQPPSAANPTLASVQFTGTLDPENSPTFYHFAYVPASEYQRGTSDPYVAGGTTNEINAGAGVEDETVGPLAATDLQPGTTYDYALVATNSAGTSIGEEHTFTTSPVTPPVAMTGGASGISQRTATLEGTVDTSGLQTNYGFEIATQPGEYGPATGLGSLGGALTQTVALTLGELHPGTTYYYRVTANNADGTSYGTPQTFSTPGLVIDVALPVAPTLIAPPAIAFPIETKTPTTSTPKALTNEQKLARALTGCKQQKGKKKQAACQKQARKRYAPKRKVKKKT
jgi:hypothetical protein